MKKQLIHKNAEWWADTIRPNSPNWDNGDIPKGMTPKVINGHMENLRAEITPEMLDVFTKKLAELLEAEFETGEKVIRLKVDYHPCRLLREATTFAEFGKCQEYIFPCKTTTYLYMDDLHLIGKIGDGQPLKIIRI